MQNPNRALNTELVEIGKIQNADGHYAIHLHDEFAEGLTGLDGFGYIMILWWFDGTDNPSSRSKLTEYKPYTKGPQVLGTFATRSPERPNPIAVTTAFVTSVDYEQNIISLAYIDANDGTPVLDIKPYTPAIDRVNYPIVPKWCAHWPNSLEKSGKFDWESEFNF